MQINLFTLTESSLSHRRDASWMAFKVVCSSKPWRSLLKTREIEVLGENKEVIIKICNTCLEKPMKLYKVMYGGGVQHVVF